MTITAAAFALPPPSPRQAHTVLGLRPLQFESILRWGLTPPSPSSFCRGHNQRMEFLGDSIMQLVATEYLFIHFPDHHEGHLTVRSNARIIWEHLDEELLQQISGKARFCFRDRVWTDLTEGSHWSDHQTREEKVSMNCRHDYVLATAVNQMRLYY